jgi:hypothetical protein
VHPAVNRAAMFTRQLNDIAHPKNRLNTDRTRASTSRHSGLGPRSRRGRAPLRADRELQLHAAGAVAEFPQFGPTQFPGLRTS